MLPARGPPPGSGGGDRLRIFLQNRQPAAGEAQADNAAIAETMRPKQGERKSFDLQVERVQCSAMAGDKDVPILRQLLKGIQKTSGAAQHGIQAFAALRRRIILRRFKKGRTSVRKSLPSQMPKPISIRRGSSSIFSSGQPETIHAVSTARRSGLAYTASK